MGTSETAAGAVTPHVSIVIPAYNEARRIGDTIVKIEEFLHTFDASSELIVVDDGSSDDTAEIAERRRFPGLRVLRSGSNHGKGYSVRQGALDARGEFVLFSDADLSAPIEELPKLLAAARRENADVVVGSRALDRSLIGLHQPRFRESGGILFNLLVRVLLGLNIRDTQCGFKLFRRERAIDIFRRQTIPGFGFDPEILFLASRMNLKIIEVPVRWNHAEGSKIHFLRDGTRMFFDLVRIRWNSIRGIYS
ncbi:MAG TPA: dolichyl-phosphate beta-glucosyltransferase [Terriglobia bacterium]|nr:dolichyl-phosphate beta-glucosyltransferase [Terriglobia bacterium]